MPLLFRCECGQELPVSADPPAQALRCPACGRELTIPRVRVAAGRRFDAQRVVV